jgi:hypothetical protein
MTVSNHLRAKRNNSGVDTAFQEGERAMKKRIAFLVGCAVAMTLAGGAYADKPERSIPAGPDRCFVFVDHALILLDA